MNITFILTGLADETVGGEPVTVQYDWADRLAMGGFHADRWHWLRGLGRASYCPRIVNRGTYNIPGGRCRCETCRGR